MKRSIFLVVFLVSSITTFSQTKLNLNLNKLKVDNVECELILYLSVNGEIEHYKYFISNDEINGIVYLTEKEHWEKIPIRGEIDSESLDISYSLNLNGNIYKGAFIESIEMGKDNYFIFEIEDNNIIIRKHKTSNET